VKASGAAWPRSLRQATTRQTNPVRRAVFGIACDNSAVLKPTRPSRRRFGIETARPTSTGLGLGVLALVGVVVPIVIASVTRSFAIPHNDDWAYSRIAETFGHTGHIELVGWNRAFLLGQVVILGPLGRWIVAQHVFVALTGVVAIAATYALLEPRVGKRRALLGAAIVAVWPGFGLLSTSFMTDVPSFAAMVLALALGDAAIRRSSLWLLAFALAVGVWGFTIREQAVAAVAAVAVAAIAQIGRRRGVLALVAASAALCFSLEAWRRGLAHGDSPTDHLINAAEIARETARAYFTLAAPLLPAALTVDLRRWSRSSWVAALLVAAVGLKLTQSHGYGLLLGNYFTRYVAYSKVSVGAPLVVPNAVWVLVLIAAIVSGALLAGAFVARWRALDLSVGTFTVLSFLLLVLALAVDQPVFDRYLLVFVPACVVVTAGRLHRRPVPLRSYVALVGVGAISLVILTATLAYDGARWHTAARLGVPPRDVDAGFEWVGSHARLPVATRPAATRRTSFYLRMFPGFQGCYVVAGPSGRSIGGFIRTYEYSWLAGSHRLRLSRRC
jgi:hypothetical protein